MIYPKACCSVAALLLAPLLLPAEERKADAPKQESGAAQLDSLQKQLDALRAEVADLRKKVNLGEQARIVETQSFNARLDEIKKSVNGASARISQYFTPATAGPARTSGTIRMENRSGVAASVVLGVHSYRLMPMETTVLAQQPVGNFTYSVAADGFGEIRPPATRSLAAGETFTIAINPS